MSKLEDLLYRRTNDLRRKSIPFIAYCHYGSFCDTSGLTVFKLIRYQREQLVGKRTKMVEINNAFSSSFLKSLNKNMKPTRINGCYECVTSIAYLAPLKPEDRAKVIECVPELSKAEILE
jgi:hypothetical protein